MEGSLQKIACWDFLHLHLKKQNDMGCCKSKEAPWDENFIETELSSNKCDAVWENIRGVEATFGMGPHHSPCARFGILPGVIRCQVGFSGGTSSFPSYDNLGDYTLAINVEYDPKNVKYAQLLHIFLNYHDIFLTSETPENKSVIFYRTPEEQQVAMECLNKEQDKHEHKIVTVITPFTSFVPAEDEKQHLILQTNREVMHKLGKRLQPFQMGYSHLACKLDGYLAGYSKPEEFDKELTELYIPEHVAALVRKICEKNQIPEPGADHMNDWG